MSRHTANQSRSKRIFSLLCGLVLLLANCSAQPAAPTPLPAPSAGPAADVQIRFDPSQSHAISPLIYGLSHAPPEVLAELRLGLNSWGGNPNTRYNWRDGNAWNAGRDWFYMNVEYGHTGEHSASDELIASSLAAGAEVRVALPTLGWVAKNNDNTVCSFPKPDGSCGDAEQASCQKPGAIADPNRANLPSDVNSIREWVQQMVKQQGFRVRFFAMDNEPELWGYTHYDVHPTCTTYDEILAKYLEYATMVREEAPESELLGPVTCCWYYYWNSAAGTLDKLKHGNQEFLPWFLDQVRAHDEQYGKRTLDVLDIHFYPEGVFNADTDPATVAHRLRSTRSLWDRTYTDESWIEQPIYLIPRMKELIDAHYPGTQLGISEWNWGAEEHISGALAIADVLGILGRENVYLASYWTFPKLHSPGFYAFKLYTNYDGQGGHFGDTAIAATSSLPDDLAVYAARDSRQALVTIMLINKNTGEERTAALDLQTIGAASEVTIYRYSEAHPDGIISETIDLGTSSTITLPAASITLVVTKASQ